MWNWLDNSSRTHLTNFYTALINLSSSNNWIYVLGSDIFLKKNYPGWAWVGLNVASSKKEFLWLIISWSVKQNSYVVIFSIRNVLLLLLEERILMFDEIFKVFVILVLRTIEFLRFYVFGLHETKLTVWVRTLRLFLKVD